MGRKLSNEDFVNRIKTLVGDEYTFLEQYKGRHSKLKCRHNSCGYVWNVEAGAFLGNKNFKGSRCPQCCSVNNHQKSHATFKKQVHDLTSGEYELVSHYKNARTKVKILHKKCGHTYDVTPNSFLNNSRCWYCGKCGHFYDTTIANEVLRDKTLGAYQLLGEYKSATEKVVIQHISCGACFEDTFQQIASHGISCPRCYGSHGESAIANWLTKENKYFLCQKTFKGLKYKSLLSYDFCIPSDKVLIEYQGIQHYEPVEFFGGVKKFEMQQESDRRKRKYATEHGYKLIAIPYTYKTQDEISNFLYKNY